MATTGNFPGSHTTTTTTTTTRVVVAPCQFDPSYCQTTPGILKIVQLILDIIGFIILSSTYRTDHGSWFSFVSMMGFIVTLSLLILYICHLIERFYLIPWLLMEFVYCSVWTFFFLLAACLVLSYHFVSAAYIVGGIFGFLAMFAYGFDAFLKYRGWRAGDVAQGERHIASSTTATATAY